MPLLRFRSVPSSGLAIFVGLGLGTSVSGQYQPQFVADIEPALTAPAEKDLPTDLMMAGTAVYFRRTIPPYRADLWVSDWNANTTRKLLIEGQPIAR